MLNEQPGSTIPERSDPVAGAPIALPAASVFVGRSAELSELRAGLDAAIAGQGRLVLISGEPGIGKTRLAGEFTSEARALGAAVHWGRCWEAGGAPSYWPWVEVIRQVLDGIEPDVVR